ncbi:SDR family oxidoreductase [Asticcacaulis sp. BYS171W]|uniref:SDR family oxidoreductase n=1 Tax=Asticcacaulis aquaticus TaxID=2984212 RepID=A0ABT5HUI1_9CAUL|nr:SDR family oxidoreductase [Asticcacaulis aquaticus]MDC7683742.1 SDR family oxidoreductase [Asticcacaulis aquaticus]
MTEVALITGGTRGIGLAIGLALARGGAQVILTHRWGSDDPQTVVNIFTAEGLLVPEIVEADVGEDGDTEALMAHIDRRFGRLDIFVSNACVAARADGLASLAPRDLTKTLQRSAWPLIAYIDSALARFGRVPRVSIGVSSDGAQHFYPGYDYVAAAKSVLEALIAAEAPRILAGGGRIFGLSTRQVDTDSMRRMFDADTINFLLDEFKDYALDARVMGDATVELCSGRLDALNGQVLFIDKGAAFLDNTISILPPLLHKLMERA